MLGGWEVRRRRSGAAGHPRAVRFAHASAEEVE